MRKPSNHGHLLATTVCLCAVFTATLQGQSSNSARTWRIADAPAELRPAISRGEVIIAAMHDALLWELNSGLEQGGPLLAIKSCHIDSTRVAQRVGPSVRAAQAAMDDRTRSVRDPR
jgi:hypothetical protein